MYYNLFLDDQRQPKDAIFFDAEMHIVEPPLVAWVIVRNYNQFVEVITRDGLPSFVTFDHDLADEHYIEGVRGSEPKYGEYKEKTGYECAKWLVDYCLDKKLPPPTYYCHSFNSIGRENIISLLNSYRKFYDARSTIHDSNGGGSGEREIDVG